MTNMRCEILTGRFEAGTNEQKEIICRILGENAPEVFKLYFHWYNLVHEIAHAISCFNARERLPGMLEELYANDFAVAYWATYGEEEKLKQLNDLVANALTRFRSPVPIGRDYLEYFQESLNNGDLYNFNDYGWFQFTSVQESLHKRQTFKHVLEKQFDVYDEISPKKLSYNLHEEGISQKIVDDARDILLAWGLKIPPVTVRFIDNPEDHRITTVESDN